MNQVIYIDEYVQRSQWYGNNQNMCVCVKDTNNCKPRYVMLLL